MTRLSAFSAPFLLGFEALEERADRLSRAGDGYPPYNIERIPEADGAETFLVTLAVAGFSAAELEVTTEDGQLVIRGRHHEAGERDYLHRGIATRQFQRGFLLAEGMQVREARLSHGLLVVSIARRPADKRSRRIDIRTV